MTRRAAGAACVAGTAILLAGTGAYGQKAVFGLELGRPLAAMTVCTKAHRDTRTEYCRMAGSGRVLVPTGRYPDYIDHEPITVTTDGSGRLVSVEFKTHESPTRLLASLSKRFGEPTIKNLQPTGIQSAQWRGDGIQTGMLCHSDQCSVQFQTHQHAREQWEKYEKDRAKRSPTP